MITLSQRIKAARALADITQQQLAEVAGINVTTLRNIEAEAVKQDAIKQSTYNAIKQALERYSVYYTETGVEKRQDTLRVLSGPSWFDYLLEDILIKAEAKQFDELLLTGVDDSQSPSHVIDMYRKIRKNGISMRQLIKEGNCYRNGPNHEYHYVPNDAFLNWPVLVYGDYIAMCTDYENECHIIYNKKLADIRRKEFDIMWKAYKEPNDKSIAEERF